MKKRNLLILSILTSFSLGMVLFNVPSKVEIVDAYTNGDGATYYNSIGQYSKATTLTTELNTLNNTKRQRLISYNSLQNYFSQTDPGSRSGEVTAFYSGTSARYSGNMNREHVWPYSKLYLNGEDRINEGENEVEQDLHMVRPAMKDDNTGRGNSFFTEPSGEGWDPGSLGDESYRGDAARIIFYCTIADLHLTLVDKDYDSKYNHTMGRLSTLLKWNIDYPVKQREKTRNESVESIQGHRNPFIDHPEYACRIWGNTNAATMGICSAYGVSGELKIKNNNVASNEFSLETNSTLNLTATNDTSLPITFNWLFANEAGGAKPTDVASLSSTTGSSVSIQGLKEGTCYIRVNATVTLPNNTTETLWKLVKVVVSREVVLTELRLDSLPRKTDYYVNEPFVSNGIKAVAVFSNDTEKDVTSEVTYSGLDFSSAGAKQITVTYTYKDVTATNSFYVMVRKDETAPTSSGGCGGNIATTSILLSSLALVSALLITVTIKKKSKK